jgi:hypothetical protein
MARIELEIAHLTIQRDNPPVFFAKKHKKTLEERMQALSFLKEELNNANAAKAIDEVIETLSMQEKNILNKYESRFIQYLRAWQQIEKRKEVVHHTAKTTVYAN